MVYQAIKGIRDNKVRRVLLAVLGSLVLSEETVKLDFLVSAEPPVRLDDQGEMVSQELKESMVATVLKVNEVALATLACLEIGARSDLLEIQAKRVFLVFLARWA